MSRSVMSMLMVAAAIAGAAVARRAAAQFAEPKVGETSSACKACHDVDRKE